MNKSVVEGRSHTTPQVEKGIAPTLHIVEASAISRFTGQPRRYFRQSSIDELAESIDEEGQNTPIQVTPDPEHPGRYILIDGERRWRACTQLSKKYGNSFKMKVVVEHVVDLTEHFKRSVIANLHREDMCDLDIAASITQLKASGLDNRQIAKIYGKSHGYVTSYQLLDTVCDNVKELMSLDRADHERLGTSKAIEIARVKDSELQTELALEALEARLTVQDTRSLIEARTRERGVTVGSNRIRERKVSDDYSLFAATLLKLRKRVIGFKKLDVLKLYTHKTGAEARRHSDILDIEAIIEDLNYLKDRLSEPDN